MQFSRQRVVLAGTLVALVAFAAAVQAGGPSDPLKCKRTIAKEGGKFIQAKLKALQKCEDAVVKDKLPDPGPGSRFAFCFTELKTSAKIAKAISKLGAKIDKACGGADKTCGTGDDNLDMQVDLGFGASCPNFENSSDPDCTSVLDDCKDVANCIECIHEAAVDQAIELYYDDFVDTPDPGGADKELNKCQQAIGKETAKYFLAKEKIIAKCWDKRFKGKHTDDCPDDTAPVGSSARKAAEKIAKAESQKIAKICKKCGGPDKNCDDLVTPVNPLTPTLGGSSGSDDLAVAAIGFAATCPAVIVPAGPGTRLTVDCGAIGTIGTLADLVYCLDCVTEFKVDCVVPAEVPEFNAYPSECNPTGPTPTPTVTPTPTPTPPTPTPTLTATPTPPTPTPTAAPLLVDHYKVYIAIGPDAPPVTLEDQFGPQGVDLGSVVFFMNPADKEGEGILEPAQHLTSYDIPVGTFGPAAVDVDNQFGLQTLSVYDPRFLAVPSQKALFPDPLPPAGPFTIDHYKCYDAAGSPTGLTLGLNDQFWLGIFDVGPPLFFCNPVDKNGEGIADPDGHLTCYSIGPPAGSPSPTPAPSPPPIVVRNQFHDGIDVTIVGPTLNDLVALCVPSRKLNVTLLPTPTVTATPTAPVPTPTTTLTPPAPTPTVTATPVLLVDHYKLYIANGLAPGLPVTLIDQFLDDVQPMGPIVFFMNPVDKNSEGILEPAQHLNCYDVPGSFAATVTVLNQFGLQSLDVGDSRFLAVPSEKAVWPDSLPGVPIPLTIDHYRCYEALGLPLSIPVTLQDQFDPLPVPDVLVEAPEFFCNPVDKNGEGINEPEGHLTCYQIALGPVPLVPVLVRNQFHIEAVDVLDPFTLCVPSLKLDVTLPP